MIDPSFPNGQEFLVQSCHPILADATSSSQNILRVKLHGAMKRKSSAINTDHFYTTRSVLPSCNSEYPELLHTLTISTFRIRRVRSQKAFFSGRLGGVGYQSGNNINLLIKAKFDEPHSYCPPLVFVFVTTLCAIEETGVAGAVNCDLLNAPPPARASHMRGAKLAAKSKRKAKV